MSRAQIRKTIGDWVNAAKLAVQAGFDVIEIHGAHGYLIHELCSPVSNKRTDEYGGSFKNRVRLALEIARGIRAAIPDSTLLFYRISATEWMSATSSEKEEEEESSWTIEQSIQLSELLKPLGVDLIDVSSGGISPLQQLPPLVPAYQAPLSKAIKDGVPGILTSAVGKIWDAKTAEHVVSSGMADVVFIGREFARNPSLVLDFAYDLGVRVKWPVQLHRSQPR
ncbi:hypothetical protein MPDQ_002400 [Monascus purpureus]|uniref:NADH:flavin oxidoreductase/NADH oxidase N-terminal domain-containing protein n=1 Tax=Monascus purpureus TaxID=5098 RepID=A0A507QPW1_MONPU|nr:hypothetical protein MPDQ_002400 [Monascus purpureus]BDD62999.1 hypothetical protein MAP00_007950 [Monascus purpureus]